jgi:hypothetical protein
VYKRRRKAGGIITMIHMRRLTKKEYRSITKNV